MITESRKRTITTAIIDFIILVLFIGAAEPRPTGILWHEWLGIAFGVIAIVHIYRSWDWIIAGLTRLFGHQTAATRFSLILNILVFVTMTIAVASGVAISREALKTLGLTWLTNNAWRSLHGLSAEVSVLLVAVHIAMHWKWIVGLFKRRAPVAVEA
ncbi:MAG: hypothetical protein RLY87_1824 [Chloroflexota bacterium]